MEKSRSYTIMNTLRIWKVNKGVFHLFILVQIAPYNSVMGVGYNAPNPKQNVILANGAEVPCGSEIDIETKQKRKNPKDKTVYRLRYNEYVVYKPEQVRIRYVVQVN